MSSSLCHAQRAAIFEKFCIHNIYIEVWFVRKLMQAKMTFIWKYRVEFLHQLITKYLLRVFLS